ncbi:oxidoreductase, short chain dehydrogenase/reductase family protein [Ancylostoma caninum]|uniref:Oxidoreductase, short chain dehydrogenase/reductase family protein n=1 Tax=Ancylostoma caninum TaxID=29170 RepID=A0A368GYS1_ANCCA|nr:oxidoreductase, short chain dehydrogenase/reductase family protein [Ancylostoma caninum]
MNSNDLTTNEPATANIATASSSERTRKFGPRTDALETIADVDLTGKTILITGTTSGIGTETARALALKGAHVVMANRNIVQSEALKARIIAEKPDAKIDMIMCDLSSLQSVQAAAKEYKEKNWPLHALILNAGVFSPTQKMTIDGLETSFGVNHVAHQYLVRELLPLLRQSNARIVVVSSHSHNHTGLKPEMSLDEKLGKLCPTESTEFGYKLYAYSKLCNVLMAMKLHRDENKNGISVYVLHPGTMIGTGWCMYDNVLHGNNLVVLRTGKAMVIIVDISRSYGLLGKFWNVVSKPYTKSLAQGAATSVYCAASPEVLDISGKYWESCWDDEKNLDAQLARDEQLQDALWDKTDKLLDKYESSRQPIKKVDADGN